MFFRSLGRLELVSYFRTLWSINCTGQIDSEQESSQLEEIDGSVQRANGLEPSQTEAADKHDCIPIQIGWTDHLDDDEMILACHTWVVHSGWNGMTTSRTSLEYIRLNA